MLLVVMLCLAHKNQDRLGWGDSEQALDDVHPHFHVDALFLSRMFRSKSLTSKPSRRIFSHTRLHPSRTKMKSAIDIPLAQPVVNWLVKLNIHAAGSEYPARRLIHIEKRYAA